MAKLRVSCRIDRLAKTGEGVAAYDERTVFVEGALPGERVLVELDPSERVIRGELLAILEESNERRPSLCPLDGRCGGCDWLHLSESAQLRAKEEIVASALEHLGQVPRGRYETLASWSAEAGLGYRRRAVLHPVEGRLGFFGKKSHEAVPVERCLALVPALEGLPGSLGEALGPIARDLSAVHLFGEGASSSFAAFLKGPVRDRHREVAKNAVRALKLAGAVLRPPAGSHVLVGRPVVKSVLDGLGGARFVRADAFVQANAQGNCALVRHVADEVGPEAGNAIELFAGNGNFTLALAGLVRSLVAVESDPVGIELADRGVRESGALNVRLVRGESAKVVRGLVSEGARFDLLVADPPRSGAAGLGSWAKDLGVRKVIYVSCDPGSLAREASDLFARGFVPRRLKVLDLFPQTRHVEAVMTFEALPGEKTT